MDEKFLIAFAITFVAGIATSIGSALTFLIKKNDFKIMALGMSFSAGVMIYISFMDILPESIHFIRDGSQTVAGLGGKLGESVAVGVFFIGVIIAALIDLLLPEHVSHEMISEKHHADEIQPSNARFSHNMHRGKAAKAGMMTAIALAVHNFPEGLSVFVTSYENITLGLSVGVAIMLHNIPEGVSVSLPIYNETNDRKKAFLIGTLSGLTEPIGALFAYFIFAPLLSPIGIGIALSITAGIMVYIALDELLPMAREYGEEHYGIIGAFSGMLLMAIVSIFFTP